MIVFLAGVATGFFLVAVYGVCVREWDESNAKKIASGAPYAGRVEPWYVRWWYYFFAGGA